MNNQFTKENPFSRIISSTQSKYVLVKKEDGSTGQGSYNLSGELEQFLKDNNIIVSNQEKSNETNIYYVLAPDIKLKLSKRIIDLIGSEYDNDNNKIYFDHTIAADGTEKLQIKRTDHKYEKEFMWFQELYDKNCEGAEFKIYYDFSTKELWIDNDMHIEEEMKEENVVEEELTTLEKYRKFYLNNIETYKSDSEAMESINLRQEFVNEYPLEKIKSLTLEEYALGTDKFMDALSYKLEFGKYKHCGMGIGGGASTKHGIYKSKDGLYHGYKNAIIDNPEEYWNNFRYQLYSFLVDVGSNDVFPNVDEKYPLIKTIPIVSAKLCFLYYPNKFISIGSRGKLQSIIDLFEIDTDEDKISSKMSYIISKFIKENVPEVNSEDPQWIGYSLWRFVGDAEENQLDNIEDDENYESYSKEDFLNEVFIDEDKYNTIVSILEKKKNIILEGAPGVGKTFMAKRLAYSILKSKDKNRVKLIQFHQSYSYEDFIEGYRPTENGFELQRGIFYNLCKKAKNDINNKYYIIIDEINRGNLSKIFGELLMLIESDKRGDSLSLAYSEEDFSVPSNLYIIGLMNTADRSLALIDYALRRRFSFIRIEPAFDSEKFKKDFNNKFDNQFNNIIDIIKKINEAIENDKSLGSGFKIGHSYFCPDLKDRKGNKRDIQDIITYEIIPLLEEYWYDDEDSLVQWKSVLNGVIND